MAFGLVAFIESVTLELLGFRYSKAVYNASRGAVSYIITSG